jgi:hypothetical protein
MSEVLKGANLVLAFLLLLCALGAFASFAYWGIFGAPRAVVPVPGLLHFVIQALFFGLAALSLAVTGHRTLGGRLWRSPWSTPSWHTYWGNDLLPSLQPRSIHLIAEKWNSPKSKSRILHSPGATLIRVLKSDRPPSGITREPGRLLPGLLHGLSSGPGRRFYGSL